jgi:penicillin amidase
VTEEFDEPRRLIGVSLPGTPYVLWDAATTLPGGSPTPPPMHRMCSSSGSILPIRTSIWRPPAGFNFGQKEETIRVKGGDARVFTRRWTRHGPVLPAGYKHFDKLLPDNTVAALQWTALAHDDTTALVGPGFMPCGRSRTSRTALTPS